MRNGLCVHKDGKIFDGGQELSHENSLYDSDTDLFRAIETVVTYDSRNNWGTNVRRRTPVDALMSAAGCVAGDRYQLQDPVILHLDENWLNFDSSNLEWCEKSDPRYISYIKKRKEDMNSWNKANNKDFPDFLSY